MFFSGRTASQRKSLRDDQGNVVFIPLALFVPWVIGRGPEVEVGGRVLPEVVKRRGVGVSFWDQVRRLFGGGGTAQQNLVRDAMLGRVARKERFTALDIANEVTANDPHRTADDLRLASDTVHPPVQRRAAYPAGLRAGQRGHLRADELAAAAAAAAQRGGRGGRWALAGAAGARLRCMRGLRRRSPSTRWRSPRRSPAPTRPTS